jgi:hypothetical protein
VVEKLEWAYQNREKLGAIGKRAGRDMQQLTWGKSGAGIFASAESVIFPRVCFFALI